MLGIFDRQEVILSQSKLVMLLSYPYLGCFSASSWPPLDDVRYRLVRPAADRRVPSICGAMAYANANMMTYCITMRFYAPDILYPVKYIVKLRSSHPLGDSAKDNTTDRGAVKNTLWTVFGLHNQGWGGNCHIIAISDQAIKYPVICSKTQNAISLRAVYK